MTIAGEQKAAYSLEGTVKALICGLFVANGKPRADTWMTVG